jgi:hypothetical protein
MKEADTVGASQFMFFWGSNYIKNESLKCEEFSDEQS